MKQIWTEFDTQTYKNFKAALEARKKLAEEAEDKTEKENTKSRLCSTNSWRNDQLWRSKDDILRTIGE